MKKIFPLFICLFFAVITLFSPQIFALQEKKLCVAFGDSIASGYGIDNVNQTYPAIISKRFGLYCENNAVSGDKSADMLAVIANTTSVQDAALITISIGGNDLIMSKDIVLAKAVSDKMKAMGLPTQSVQKLIREINISGVFNGSAINFETIDEDIEGIFSSLYKNLSDAVKLLHTVNEDAVIIVQTLYNPYINNPEYQIFGFDVGTLIDEYIRKINETYYAVQSELGDTFIIADVASGMNGNSTYFYTSWDFHPTAQGHAYMAEIIGDIYGKSIGASATTESVKTTSAPSTSTTAVPTTETTITTAAVTTTLATTVTEVITADTIDNTTTKTSPVTSVSESSFTNVPTEEPDIPTAAVPDVDDNVKTTVYICIALVCLISIGAGVIIKKNK